MPCARTCGQALWPRQLVSHLAREQPPSPRTDHDQVQHCEEQARPLPPAQDPSWLSFCCSYFLQNARQRAFAPPDFDFLPAFFVWFVGLSLGATSPRKQRGQPEKSSRYPSFSPRLSCEAD